MLFNIKLHHITLKVNFQLPNTDQKDYGYQMGYKVQAPRLLLGI